MAESLPVPAVPHAGDRSAPLLVDQSDYLTNIDWLAEYEFFYRRPFASPPELKIVEEGAPPFIWLVIPDHGAARQRVQSSLYGHGRSRQE